MFIRVVELGATKIRRADVFEKDSVIKVLNFIEGETFSFSNLPFDLINYFKDGLQKETEKIICLIAGPIENYKVVKEMPNLFLKKAD